MSYRLDAVIGDFDRLRSWAAGVAGAVVAPLGQRMGLLPLTAELRADLPGSLRALSRSGPVAHVTADFWAGDGEQTAALWRAGVLEWGPVGDSEFRGPREEWPINAVLARLGAVSAGPGAPEHNDLFVAVGLGQGRDERDWHAAALTARDVADYDAWQAREAAERESRERAAAARAVHERLPGIPVPLSGKDVITLLGIPPGRTVGAAIRHLQQLHIDGGPQSREAAETALLAWAAECGVIPAPASGSGGAETQGG
ncbi:hypothetical protein AB0O01_01145 [Streptomyces sp. NPDC093252]|uniref:hypothetical protein n=1 Tax=Streptomyces sp. NPDC093252 TaxID=3154980 RepID=UPI0034370D08